MLKNIWLGITALTIGALIWTGAILSIDLFKYLQLTRKTHPTRVHWTIEGKDESQYFFIANYIFNVDGKEYRGVNKFKRPTFPNMIAAEAMLPHWQAGSWPVWYSGFSPKTNAMQKNFPFQNLIHFVLALGVFFYFRWLREYVHRMGYI
ncbi:MAG: hypothetical protein MRY21_00720 [Simkaniaceae bacterium]|nr:hypothetical protein [Simkaniaceae bacterium]